MAASPTTSAPAAAPTERPPRLGPTFWLAEALLVAPVLLDLLSGGRRVFAYLAADTYYYLTVARSLVATGRPSFDGEHLTNGFHPLWQAMTAALAGLLRPFGESPTVLLTATVLLCLSLVAVALWVLARVLRAGGPLHPLFAGIPLGLHGLLLAPVWIAELDNLPEMNPFEGSPPLWGTLWFAVNGMETGVLLLAFALLGAAFVLGSPLTSRRDAVWLGLAMGMVALARLDHVFFPAALGLGLLLRAGQARDVDAVTNLLLGAAVGAVPVVLYLAWNALEFGHLTPVSGRLKTTFPVPTGDNVLALASLFRPDHPPAWVERSGRVAAMVVPALFALVEIALGPRTRMPALKTRSAARLDSFLRSAAVGCLLLGAYDFFFVRWSHQGHWYLPVSVLLVSVWTLRWLGRAQARSLRRGPKLVWRVALHAAVPAVALAAFVTLHRHEDSHARYATFVLDLAPRIRAHYAEAGETPRLVEMDDGVIAFGTGYPTMPSTGLTLDEAAVEAVQEGKLFDLALARGFDRFTSAAIDRQRVAAGLAPLRRTHRVELEWSAPEIGFGIWRVTER